MRYRKIVEGTFVDRPNRFIAHVEIGGNVETVHVKNTGRCRELLQPGAKVYLEESDNPARKTKYDLVKVWKGDRLINMDSQAPNKVVQEFIEQGKLFQKVTMIRPETTYGKSRFDFYVEAGDEKIFIEVKGVTLEEDGVVRFPDAPSERAVKHVEELVAAKKDGYQVYVLFVIQMDRVLYFTPNDATHRAFGDALRKAAAEGVKVLAYECLVTEDGLEISKEVEVRL